MEPHERKQFPLLSVNKTITISGINSFSIIMGILRLFFSSMFLFPILLAAKDCSTSSCGNTNITVRFPFILQGKQPESCGYPGFSLSCNSQSMTVLKLPRTGEFFVREINYITQQIRLYDPDNCLASRLLNLNLSGSPFKGLLHQNYTFLSCPTQFTNSRFTVIDCLSNATRSVLATSSTSLVSSLTSVCKILVTLPVPVSWPVQYDEGFSTDLNYDLRLIWDTPDCGDCEVEGGICGFKSNSSGEIGCSIVAQKGKSSMGLQIFMIICLSIAAPAVSCAVGIAVFACFADRDNRTRARSRQQITSPATVTPETSVIVNGLDESVIESYQKLVLGESRRLPGPNDITCPICFSEYCSKETLRFIPECRHCFHADCIDEWLRMNNSCPVCRHSPSPAHAPSDNV